MRFDGYVDGEFKWPSVAEFSITDDKCQSGQLGWRGEGGGGERSQFLISLYALISERERIIIFILILFIFVSEQLLVRRKTKKMKVKLEWIQEKTEVQQFCFLDWKRREMFSFTL